MLKSTLAAVAAVFALSAMAPAALAATTNPHVLLTTSAPDGISPRPVLYRTLDVVVNILRSVPFLILMVCVLGLTRFLVGTTIGSTAVIPPLVIAAAPYVGRMVEGSLKGWIERCQKSPQYRGLLNFCCLCHLNWNAVRRVVDGIVRVGIYQAGLMRIGFSLSEIAKGCNNH